MRTTVEEWKKEWIDTNGLTNEYEVEIYTKQSESGGPVYAGSFTKIPKELLNKKVLESGKILDSSIADHIGAYRLTV